MFCVFTLWFKPILITKMYIKITNSEMDQEWQKHATAALSRKEEKNIHSHIHTTSIPHVLKTQEAKFCNTSP